MESDLSLVNAYDYLRARDLLSLGGRVRHALLARPEGGPGPMWKDRMAQMAPASRTRLTEVIRASNRGFNGALATTSPDALPPLLDSVPSASLQVFAYEGAAAGLALVDLMSPWRTARAAVRFLDGPARRHYPTAVAGMGMLGGVLRLPLMPQLRSLDRFWGVGYANGYGFTAAAFRPRLVLDQRRYAGGARGYAARAFDQGVGRYLWWEVIAHGPEGAAQRLQQFAAERHADLWAGLGAASAFASGGEDDLLATIRELAGPYRAQLAFGAVGASYTRHLAGVPLDDADEQACRAYTGGSAAAAVDVLRRLHATLDLDLPIDDDTAEVGFERWRRAAVAEFA